MQNQTSPPVRSPWCSLFLLLSTDKKIEPITPEHNWGFLLYVEETILNCCKDRLESFQKHDPSCVRWNFFSGVNVRSRKQQTSGLLKLFPTQTLITEMWYLWQKKKKNFDLATSSSHKNIKQTVSVFCAPHSKTPAPDLDDLSQVTTVLVINTISSVGEFHWILWDQPFLAFFYWKRNVSQQSLLK